MIIPLRVRLGRWPRTGDYVIFIGDNPVPYLYSLELWNAIRDHISGDGTPCGRHGFTVEDKWSYHDNPYFQCVCGRKIPIMVDNPTKSFLDAPWIRGEEIRSRKSGEERTK